MNLQDGVNMPRNTHWEEIKRRKKDAYLREQDPRLALNWNTGPWINNGLWQASTTHTTPGSSEWQQSSKEHDSAWATATTREQFEKADQKYYEDNFGKGPWRSAAALAVKVGGGFLRPTTYEDTLSGKVVKRPVSKTPSTTQAAPTQVTGMKRRFETGPTQGAAKMLRGSTAAAGGGSGGVKGGTLGETPVMPYNATALIQPDYLTLRHKWVANVQMDNTTGILSKKELRVNSPLDPNITETTLTDLANKRFNGFNEQAARYRYYRLLHNHITITFCRWSDATTIAEEQQDSGPVVFGVNLNPSNRYELNSNSVNNWPQLAQARFTDWSISQGAHDKTTFTIDYTPGAWDTAIDEQHKERLWTPVIQNQGPDDRLMYWYQPLHSSIDVHCQVVITMTATIQYREWDNQVVERMFIMDQKTDAGQEVTPQATTAMTDVTDAVPVPDTYDPAEIDDEL